MNRVSSTAAVALTLCVAACGGPGAPPPMDLAPSDAAIAAALAARVNGPDLPQMAIRPEADAPPSCRDSYRVEHVAVTRTPVRDELGSRIRVDADFQVRRLAATDGAAAGLYDCFGADANDPPPTWKQGSVANLKGEGELTWRGGYWLLRIGDEFMPLPPVEAGR